MNLIWATRGKNWGFRFLLGGGNDDPLPAFESAFAGVGDDSSSWQRNGAEVALRFPDPEGRKDHAGRVIPHEFVVFGPLAERVNSVEDGLQLVWPLVAEDFARIWDSPKSF